MKIALINGSPKTSKNNSQYFADELGKLLPGCQLMHVRINRPQISREHLEWLTGCDALVFCFPLYVDAVPAHLLAVLQELEAVFRGQSAKPRVYAIVNCGFYEGIQNYLALDVMRNWSERAGLLWERGIGIGAGEMLGSLDAVPCGRGPKVSLGKELKTLADSILQSAGGKNAFVIPNFPRFAFLFTASLGWKRQAKTNGVRKKDMFVYPV